MWTPEYFVRYAPLPPSIEGVTLPNDDGSFDIYINAALSPDRQTDRLRHELRHIEADHFYRDTATVAACEAEAEGIAAAPPPESPALKRIKEENSTAARMLGIAPAPAAAEPTPPAADLTPATAEPAPAPVADSAAPDYFPGLPRGIMPHFDSPEAFLRYYLANLGGV